MLRKWASVLHRGGQVRALTAAVAVAAHSTRAWCSSSSHTTADAATNLVVGAWKRKDDAAPTFTQRGAELDAATNGWLQRALALAGFDAAKSGGMKLVLHSDAENPARVAVVALGEDADVGTRDAREAVRTGVSAAVRALKASGSDSVQLDQFEEGNAPAVEGALLGLWTTHQLGLKKPDAEADRACAVVAAVEDDDAVRAARVRAEGQNLARKLADMPANHMTPRVVCETALGAMDGIANMDVSVFDEAWAAQRKMGSFLSVTAGSEEPAKYLQMKYSGGKEGDAPLVLVGKGVTFDAGGISIKPAAGMGDMRGDMGGAAAVIGAMYAISKLQLPVNVVGLTPLCENMPSGSATKPSDVVRASNGLTIEVDNTDAEGRLILADALVHACEFKPRAIVDVATLTGAMVVALGEHATGAFSSDDALWAALREAGERTGERMWRMPLFPEYKKQLESTLADVKNIGGRAAGSCTAAVFLQHFVDDAVPWVHLDIAGVMCKTSNAGYHVKGFTGMPVRTLVELAASLGNE